MTGLCDAVIGDVEDFLRQTPVITGSIPVMKEQRDLLFGQIDRISVFDQHSGEIRPGPFTDRIVFRTRECDELFQRETVDVCQPDQDINVRDAFSCFIIGVCLPGNVQPAADLQLCKIVPASEIAQIFPQLDICHRNTSIYKKSF